MKIGYVIDRIKQLSTKGMSNSHFEDTDRTDMINQILDYIFIYMNSTGLWYYSNTVDRLTAPASGRIWKTSNRLCSIFEVWALDANGNKIKKFHAKGISVDIQDGYRQGSIDPSLNDNDIFVKVADDKIALNQDIPNDLLVIYSRLPRYTAIDRRDDDIDLPEELKMALYSGVMWLVDGDGFLEQGVSLGNAKFQKMENYLKLYSKSIGLSNPMSNLII